uniref:Uncharacterized protein n=1 Tax=Arundo donax TaxID=35708 RepID=A0A0A8XQ88_ARUDO
MLEYFNFVGLYGHVYVFNIVLGCLPVNGNKEPTYLKLIVKYIDRFVEINCKYIRIFSWLSTFKLFAQLKLYWIYMFIFFFFDY